MMGGEKYGDGTAHDPKHTTSCIKYRGGRVMGWTCMTASGRSIRMNSREYTALLTAQSQPNATELIGWCFKMQMDDKREHTIKSFLKQINVIFFNGQVSHLISTQYWHPFQLLMTKMMAESPIHETQLRVVAVKDLQSISWEEIHTFLIARDFHPIIKN